MRSLLLLSASLALVACAPSDSDGTPEAAPTQVTPPTRRADTPTATPSTASSAAASSTNKRGKRSRGKLGQGPRRPTVQRPAIPAASTPSEVERNAGMLARCSDGHVVFGLWQGEYPSPVVQLDKSVRVDVSDSPCAGPARACMVKAGLLHPWADDAEKSGQLLFATRTRTISYTLLKDHKLAGQLLKKGTRVEVLSYLSEGLCSMLVDGQEQGAVEAMCPGTGANDRAIWSSDGDENPPSTQLVKVGCKGGPPGWLLIDDAFVGRRDVREGQMSGYGEVRRSQ